MGSKNVPEKFQLCFVDVVSERGLLGECSHLLVCVGACCGVEHFSVVGVFEVQDFPQAL